MNQITRAKFVTDKKENIYKEFTNNFPNANLVGIFTKANKWCVLYNCGNKDHKLSENAFSLIMLNHYDGKSIPCKDCRDFTSFDVKGYFYKNFPNAIINNIYTARITDKAKCRLLVEYNCGNINHNLMKVDFSDIRSTHLNKNYLKCIDCQSFPTENVVKHNFESIFDITFNKIRPDFLKNPDTNCNLELDGYSVYIKNNINYPIAFEYQGEQHYEIRKRSKSQSKEDLIEQFEKIKKNDALKLIRCKENNINLFIIPYTAAQPLSKIKEYIINIALEMNIPLKNNIPDLDLQSIGLISHSKIHLDKLKEHCKSKNITVLSNNYINNLSELQFQCNNEDCPHLKNGIGKFTWWAKPMHMISERGCRKCSKTYLDIDDIKYKLSIYNHFLVEYYPFKIDILNNKSIINSRQSKADICCNLCNNKTFNISIRKIVESTIFCKCKGK